MSGYYIGMDVGGTHLRLKLADAQGAELGSYEGPGCSINLHGYDFVKEAYGDLICQALSCHQFTPRDCLGLCVGAAGVDSPALEKQYHSIFDALGFPTHRVRIYNDCELFLHCKEEQAGVVAVAGTGSITVGRDIHGAIVRCGGWGHLLSDEGSGFFLARRAMEEVIHHLDGCAECPTLARIFTQATGLESPHDISLYFFHHIGQKSDIAVFAPLVDQAADAGDPVALGILKEASESICRSIRAVSRRILPPDGLPFSVLLWGSVLLNSRYVSQAVMDAIGSEFPQAQVQYPAENALNTSLEIARKL